MAIDLVQVKLTADEYQRMIAAGIIREGTPIELIDGTLIRKDSGDGHHIVEMTAGAVVHYFDLHEGGYGQSKRYLRVSRLTLEILPSVSISIEVDDLFSS